LLESPKEQGGMEQQCEKRDNSFVLFHSGRVAIGFVRLPHNAKSHAIRALKNVIHF